MATPKKAASAKKTPAKKTAAKKAPAKATVKKTAPAVEAAPAAIPALPAPPDGYTWAVNPSDGQVTLIRTGEAATASEPVEVSNVEVSEPEVGSKTIRNLRGVPVHLRLKGDAEKLYRVQLERRGFNGDTAEIPFACTQDTTFVRSYQMGLFEIISKTEAQGIDYAPSGFQSRDLNIISPDQSTVAHKSFDTTNKGQAVNQKDLMPQNRPSMAVDIAPQVAKMPGSDPQLTAQMQQIAPRRPAPQEASVMQNETGRAEHAPNDLQSKGIMPDLPQVAGIQRVSEF